MRAYSLDETAREFARSYITVDLSRVTSNTQLSEGGKIMITLVKEDAPITGKIDADKKNFFLVGFQDSAPYQPVLVATKLVALTRHGLGTSTDDTAHAVAVVAADEPTTLENPDTKDRLVHRLQSLMSGERLTRRELELLRHVANGYANKEIAAELNISEQTVKNHMTSILYKLEAKNRAHAATLAMRMGLISPQ